VKLGISGAEIFSESSRSWTMTAGLTTPRCNASSTVLSSGRFLVAGGYDGSNAIASTELFDPSTKNWTVTGSLPGPRQGDGATLLSSGDAVVIGGLGGSVTAEVYRENSGSWIESPQALSFARYGATDTLLPDGHLLVVGGVGGDGKTVATAELFDPITGTSTPAGQMSVPRQAHAAVLLHSGKVLIVGGSNVTVNGSDQGPYASAELYDPTTATWTQTAAMSTPRNGPSANVLLSGKVLVAGGETDFATYAATDSAELYDETTGAWSRTGSLAQARIGHTTTMLPSGRLLVVGGCASAPGVCLTALASAEVYTP
jgi:hypothetical protein